MEQEDSEITLFSPSTFVEKCERGTAELVTEMTGDSHVAIHMNDTCGNHNNAGNTCGNDSNDSNACAQADDVTVKRGNFTYAQVARMNHNFLIL